MDLSGEYRIPAAMPQVWAALIDAEVLQACIRGCRELRRTSDNDFSAWVIALIAGGCGVVLGFVLGRW